MPGHGVAALGRFRFLLDRDDRSLVVEFDNAVGGRVGHLVGEDERATDIGVLLEVGAESRSVEEVVAEDEGALVAVQELLAEDEGFGESVRLVLHDVGESDSELAAVAQEAKEGLLIVGRRDEKNLAKPTQHERAQGVVNHGLVVDRQELFRHCPGDGVQAGSRTASQNDSLHPISIGVFNLLLKGQGS